jgi:hypothetical protein
MRHLRLCAVLILGLGVTIEAAAAPHIQLSVDFEF